MALISIAGKGAPCIAANFAITTAAHLHEDTRGGGNAPSGIRHLPAGVIFHGAGNFNWTDANGVDITTVVTAESVGIFCPIAPALLQADNAVACTVFWHRGSTVLR